MPHQIYNCDLCGKDDAAEIPSSRFYTNDQPIHVCRSCGFVYVRSRRSIDEIAKAWSDELFQNTYTARQPQMAARQSFVTEFIASSIGFDGKSLVDIGAGEGQFFEIINRFGHTPKQMLGIEPASQNCAMMEEQGFSSFQGTIEDYLAVNTVSQNRFDIATIMWTLENTQDCIGMLKGAFNMLEDNGHIVVSTGSRILVPFKKPLHLYFTSVPADTCNFRFSANCLRGALEDCGFIVEFEKIG